jgi:hypothetical protein
MTQKTGGQEHPDALSGGKDNNPMNSGTPIQTQQGRMLDRSVDEINRGLGPGQLGSGSGNATSFGAHGNFGVSLNGLGAQNVLGLEAGRQVGNFFPNPGVLGQSSGMGGNLPDLSNLGQNVYNVPLDALGHGFNAGPSEAVMQGLQGYFGNGIGLNYGFGANDLGAGNFDNNGLGGIGVNGYNLGDGGLANLNVGGGIIPHVGGVLNANAPVGSGGDGINYLGANANLMGYAGVGANINGPVGDSVNTNNPVGVTGNVNNSLGVAVNENGASGNANNLLGVAVNGNGASAVGLKVDNNSGGRMDLNAGGFGSGNIGAFQLQKIYDLAGKLQLQNLPQFKGWSKQQLGQ